MPNMPCISPPIYQRTSEIYLCYKQHLQWKKLEFSFGNHLDTLTILPLSHQWCQKWTTILSQNSISGYIPTYCCIWLDHSVLNFDHALEFCTSAAHWKQKYFWHDNGIKTKGCQQVPTLSTLFLLGNQIRYITVTSVCLGLASIWRNKEYVNYSILFCTTYLHIEVINISKRNLHENNTCL
jgi:hypothetical protein